MYYDRGRHIEQGCERVVLTADQVLHDGDVVSRSDGFGTTATRTPVSRTMSMNWTTSSVGITSSDAVSSKTFEVAMFL